MFLLKTATFPLTNISLEELYTGCVKKFNVGKHIYDQSGSSRMEQKILEIKVRPGWKAGTKVTFPSEGDVYPGKEPADMIFVLSEKPHAYFKRERNDLVYTSTITLRQALQGVKINIPTLDGQLTEVTITDRVIHPEFVHVVKGKGMPNSKVPGQFGDLLIKFNVRFPRALTREQKAEVKKALDGVDWL